MSAAESKQKDAYQNKKRVAQKCSFIEVINVIIVNRANFAMLPSGLLYFYVAEIRYILP